MKIESFLRRYFAHQSESEIQQRKNSIQQQERAADILVLLSFVQEYGTLPRWYRKRLNIRIPDPTQAIALASLKPYSKKLQKRTVEAIKAEVHKDIIYQLSQEISLRIGKKNAYYFLHVNDKIGLVNRDKKLIIPAIYDTIEPFIGYNYRFYNDTLFVVSQEGKKGLISQQGQRILPDIYDDITKTYQQDTDSPIKMTKDEKEGIIRLEKKKEGLYEIVFSKEPFAKLVRGIEYAAQPQYIDWIDDQDVLHMTALKDDQDDLILGSPHHRRTISRKDKKVFSLLEDEWVLREYDGKQWSAIIKTEYLGRDKDLVAVDQRNGPYFIYRKDGKYGINKRGLKDILLPIATSIIPGYGRGGDLKFFFQENNTWGLISFSGDIRIPTGKYDTLQLYGERSFYGKKDGQRHFCTTDPSKEEIRDDLYMIYLPTDLQNTMYVKQSAFNQSTLITGDGNTKDISSDDDILTALHGSIGEEGKYRGKTITLGLRKRGEDTYIHDKIFTNLIVHRGGEDDGGKYIMVTHTKEGIIVTEKIWLRDLENNPDLPF